MASFKPITSGLRRPYLASCGVADRNSLERRQLRKGYPRLVETFVFSALKLHDRRYSQSSHHTTESTEEQKRKRNTSQERDL